MFSRMMTEPGYVESLRAVVRTGGHYDMLCFSDREPGDWGPRRVTEDEIRSSFADGWTIESIKPVCGKWRKNTLKNR